MTTKAFEDLVIESNKCVCLYDKPRSGGSNPFATQTKEITPKKFLIPAIAGSNNAWNKCCINYPINRYRSVILIEITD